MNVDKFFINVSVLMIVFQGLIQSVATDLLFGQHQTESLLDDQIQRYHIPCKECSSPLEISGLTRYKNYLFILPQTQNYLYIYDLKKQQEGNQIEPKKIPFEYDKRPMGSEGWEAITYREIEEDSLEMYFGMEKCNGDNYCLLKAPIKIDAKADSHVHVEIGTLTPFGNLLKGSNNLSYEAIMWVEQPDVRGVLIIPEKLSDPNLNTSLITETGRQIPIQADSSLFKLRISDMAAHPYQPGTYLATSFCWKGVTRSFLHSNKWCYGANDEWKSRLALVALQLGKDKNGQLKLDVIHKAEFNQKFIQVDGPNPKKNHEYNAEGLAVSEQGELIMVNDNSPDGAFTELRILPRNFLYRTMIDIRN